MRRLFVAVWPPASLTDQLRGLARPQQTGLRWTTEDQWHVTLRFFGGVEVGGGPKSNVSFPDFGKVVQAFGFPFSQEGRPQLAAQLQAETPDAS